MVGFWPSQRSSSPGLFACSRSRCSPCTGPAWGPPLEGRSPHLLGPRQQVCIGGSSSRPDSRAAEAWAESRTRSMELGDGDPEGWPRKGGEVFSKQEKSRLSTPHLTPHPEGPGVRATPTHVHPSLWLLWSSAPPGPLFLSILRNGNQNPSVFSAQGYLQSNFTCIISTEPPFTRLWGGRQGWHYLDFIGGETKAQRGEAGLSQARGHESGQWSRPAKSPARPGDTPSRPPPPPAGGGGGTEGGTRSWVPCWALPLTSWVTLDKWLRLSA